jgi:hypothetical protein
MHCLCVEKEEYVKALAQKILKNIQIEIKKQQKTEMSELLSAPHLPT